MLSVFIKEQKRYSQDDLKNLFKCSEEKIVNYINRIFYNSYCKEK